LEPEKRGEVREEVANLAARLFREGSQEFDSVDETLFVVLCEAAREYLSTYPGIEEGAGWSGRDLWATVQALHENLEEEAVDYAGRAKSLPDRPTISIVRELADMPSRSSYTTGSTPTRSDIFAMAKAGILRDGMRFYDVFKRKNLAVIIEFTCDDAWSSISWRMISDDGTPLSEPAYSPSSLARFIRGTVSNPYDTWKTEDGKTLRQVYMDWKSSK
jgi:hypothetical protein